MSISFDSIDPAALSFAIISILIAVETVTRSLIKSHKKVYIKCGMRYLGDGHVRTPFGIIKGDKITPEQAEIVGKALIVPLLYSLKNPRTIENDWHKNTNGWWRTNALEAVEHYNIGIVSLVALAIARLSYIRLKIHRKFIRQEQASFTWGIPPPLAHNILHEGSLPFSGGNRVPAVNHESLEDLGFVIECYITI